MIKNTSSLITRRDIEEKDAAMAKETHREEEAFYSMCAKDDQYAQVLHDEQYAEREQVRINTLPIYSSGTLMK